TFPSPGTSPPMIGRKTGDLSSDIFPKSGKNLNVSWIEPPRCQEDPLASWRFDTNDSTCKTLHSYHLTFRSVSMRLSALLLGVVFAVPAIAAPETKSNPIDDSAKIAERLLERISLDVQLEKTSVRDALKYLQDRTDLTILIDKRALRDRGDDLAQNIDDTA